MPRGRGRGRGSRATAAHPISTRSRGRVGRPPRAGRARGGRLATAQPTARTITTLPVTIPEPSREATPESEPAEEGRDEQSDQLTPDSDSFVGSHLESFADEYADKPAEEPAEEPAGEPEPSDDLEQKPHPVVPPPLEQQQPPEQPPAPPKRRVGRPRRSEQEAAQAAAAKLTSPATGRRNPRRQSTKGVVDSDTVQNSPHGTAAAASLADSPKPTTPARIKILKTPASTPQQLPAATPQTHQSSSNSNLAGQPDYSSTAVGWQPPRESYNPVVACVKCTRTPSPSDNPIVYCSRCERTWHKFCHVPPIPEAAIEHEDVDWFCAKCIVIIRQEDARKSAAVPMQRNGSVAERPADRSASVLPAHTRTPAPPARAAIQTMSPVVAPVSTPTAAPPKPVTPASVRARKRRMTKIKLTDCTAMEAEQKIAYFGALSRRALIELLVHVTEVAPRMPIYNAGLMSIDPSKLDSVEFQNEIAYADELPTKRKYTKSGKYSAASRTATPAQQAPVTEAAESAVQQSTTSQPAAATSTSLTNEDSDGSWKLGQSFGTQIDYEATPTYNDPADSVDADSETTVPSTVPRFKVRMLSPTAEPVERAKRPRLSLPDHEAVNEELQTDPNTPNPDLDPQAYYPLPGAGMASRYAEKRGSPATASGGVGLLQHKPTGTETPTPKRGPGRPRSKTPAVTPTSTPKPVASSTPARGRPGRKPRGSSTRSTPAAARGRSSVDTVTPTPAPAVGLLSSEGVREGSTEVVAETPGPAAAEVDIADVDMDIGPSVDLGELLLNSTGAQQPATYTTPSRTTSTAEIVLEANVEADGQGMHASGETPWRDGVM